MDSANLTAELLRLKNRFDTIFNSVLIDMKPGWDDSIEGFNKAWGVAREIFADEIGRAKQRALSASPQQGVIAPCDDAEFGMSDPVKLNDPSASPQQGEDKTATVSTLRDSLKNILRLSHKAPGVKYSDEITLEETIDRIVDLTSALSASPQQGEDK